MPTTSIVSLRDHCVEQFEKALARYSKDLDALTDEQIAASPMGAARSAADFTYEVCYVHRRMAARLTGAELPPSLGEGWIKAPSECSTKAQLLEELQKTGQALADAIRAFPEERYEEKIDGMEEWSYRALIGLAATHLNYHDAQLNYIQSLYGDMEVHWN